jgi:hypothetical protein
VIRPRPSFVATVFLSFATAAVLLPDRAHCAPAPTAPYKRTIVVGGGTPAQNGAALLAAAASITTTNANNRWLIHLEPGEFAIGPATLLLRNFVDLEGSGRSSTTISSTSTINVAVFVQQTSEVRDLKIQSRAAANAAGGVMLTHSSGRLSRVDIDVEGPGATGVLVQNSAPRIDDVAVLARATVNNATGFLLFNAPLVGRRWSARIEAAGEADGVAVSWLSGTGITRVEGLFVRASSSVFATGLSLLGGQTHVVHADVVATSDFALGAAAHGSLTLEESRVATADANGSVVRTSAGTTRVIRSYLKGVQAASTTDPGVLLIESSRLEGQSIGARCVGSYDGAFEALDANCQ